MRCLCTCPKPAHALRSAVAGNAQATYVCQGYGVSGPYNPTCVCKVPFTAELPEALQLQLAHAMRWVPLAPGCALFHENDLGDNWYILVSGAATRISLNGHLFVSCC